MDSPIVSHAELQRAYDDARAADADHDLAIAMVAHFYAMCHQTVAEALEPVAEGT